jgi:hypothetical protein
MEEATFIGSCSNRVAASGCAGKMSITPGIARPVFFLLLSPEQRQIVNYCLLGDLDITKVVPSK